MRTEISGQSTLKTTAKSAAAALALVLGAAQGAAPPVVAFLGPRDAGLMAEPRERESSGLAASRRTSGLFWTHNDSGDGPVAYAVAADGARRGRLRLAGVGAEDWEDMAAFTRDGQAWLVFADAGDNFSNRPRGVLHVVAEPDAADLSPEAEITVAPAYSVHFVFEDGPRDCEAVAVDPQDGTAWLLTKHDLPARLYRLPLAAATADAPAVARFSGPVAGLTRARELARRLLPPALAMDRLPTALDFCADGKLALVLTYSAVLLYPREPDEPWPAAFARPPIRLPAHDLPQAEAACFAADARSIVVSSENTRRWLRYERAEP